MGDFARFVGPPYMFRIKNAQGEVVYRTDIHSRWQIGRGRQESRARTAGTATRTRSTARVSCSVVIDQDVVREEFEPTTSPPATDRRRRLLGDRVHARPARARPASKTWSSTSCTSARSASRAPGTGTLADAMRPARLPGRPRRQRGRAAADLRVLRQPELGLRRHAPLRHRVERRRPRQVQALRPGVPPPRHRGHPGRRLQPLRPRTPSGPSGSTTRPLPEENIYYWYEGRSSDYRDPDGGYLNNGSTGCTPRFWEEPVRQLFISSAAEFVEEFHVDGLRVDLTQAIHRDNCAATPTAGASAAPTSSARSSCASGAARCG